MTNPHEFEVDSISFLGTSGQNIDDIYKYSVEENRLTLLHKVLEWGHLVPTAPDTLTCYPLSDSDPFILESAPHVFFVGNQPSYSSQIITGQSSYESAERGMVQHLSSLLLVLHLCCISQLLQMMHDSVKVENSFTLRLLALCGIYCTNQIKVYVLT